MEKNGHILFVSRSTTIKTHTPFFGPSVEAGFTFESEDYYMEDIPWEAPYM